MIATTTTQMQFAVSDVLAARALCRRRISPEVGRALEKLSHAIEYLTDEYVHEGDSQPDSDHRLEAVQALIALRRQVYFDAPEIQPLGERCRTWIMQRLA